MRRASALTTIIASVATLLLASLRLCAAEQTRAFLAQKCRYTLPGKNWSWIDPPLPTTLFGAGSNSGLAVMVSCDWVAGAPQLDKSIADKFEAALERNCSGKLKKRGARWINYQGLPCYQIEGVYADGNTTVSRLFLAHGIAYHIMLIGTKDPVEYDADFEKIMGGFAFTEPPVVAGASDRASAAMSNVFIVGLVCCLIALALMAFARQFTRKRPRNTRRRFDDDWPETPDVRRTVDELPEVLPVATPPATAHTGVRTTRPIEPARFAEPVTRIVVRERHKGTGRCRHCGFRPLAFDAEECPNCSGRNPNPGVASRYTSHGTILGIALGAGVGAIWGYLIFPGGGPAGAIGGILLGTLPGIFLGMFGGLVLGLLAKLMGKR